MEIDISRNNFDDLELCEPQGSIIISSQDLHVKKICLHEYPQASRVAEQWKKIAHEKSLQASSKFEQRQFNSCRWIIEGIADTFESNDTGIYKFKNQEGDDIAFLKLYNCGEKFCISSLTINPINSISHNPSQKKETVTLLLQEIEKLALSEGKAYLSFWPPLEDLELYLNQGFEFEEESTKAWFHNYSIEKLNRESYSVYDYIEEKGLEISHIDFSIGKIIPKISDTSILTINSTQLYVEKLWNCHLEETQKVIEIWTKICEEKKSQATLPIEFIRSYESVSRSIGYIQEALADLAEFHTETEKVYTCRDLDGNDAAMMELCEEEDEIYIALLATNPINIRSHLNDNEPNRIQGAGTLLLQAAEKIALASGKSLVSLYSLPAAVGFYLRNGFNFVDTSAKELYERCGSNFEEFTKNLYNLDCSLEMTKTVLKTAETAITVLAAA